LLIKLEIDYLLFVFENEFLLKRKLFEHALPVKEMLCQFSEIKTDID